MCSRLAQLSEAQPLGLGEVHLWMSCLELLQEIVLLLLPQHQLTPGSDLLRIDTD